MQTIRQPVEDVIIKTLDAWLKKLDIEGEIVAPINTDYDTSINEKSY